MELITQYYEDAAGNVTSFVDTKQLHHSVSVQPGHLKIIDGDAPRREIAETMNTTSPVVDDGRSIGYRRNSH